MKISCALNITADINSPTHHNPSISYSQFEPSWVELSTSPWTYPTPLNSSEYLGQDRDLTSPTQSASVIGLPYFCTALCPRELLTPSCLSCGILSTLQVTQMMMILSMNPKIPKSWLKPRQDKEGKNKTWILKMCHWQNYRCRMRTEGRKVLSNSRVYTLRPKEAFEDQQS